MTNTNQNTTQTNQNTTQTNQNTTQTPHPDTYRFLNLKFTLQILKNDDPVNLFTGEGLKALKELVQCLATLQTKRHTEKTFYHKHPYYDELKITLIYKKNNANYKYIYLFSGDYLHRLDL